MRQFGLHAMIGFIAGIGLLFSYLGAAWSVDNSEDSLFSGGLGTALIILGAFALLGIFLFPRTVGMAFTPMSFATPVAFIIALLRHGFSYSLFILALGIGAWLVTFIVGILRPDAT
jgi:hypothetical protein